MAQRHLIIECLPRRGEQIPTRVHVEVDNHTAIRPWIATLAAHFGYPLADRFGTPIAYRLRSLSGEQVLPMTDRFLDARVPPGSGFVLEPETERILPRAPRVHPGSPLLSGFHLSRRSLISGGLLSSLSLLGLGSGMTTAFAQHLLRQQSGTTLHPPIVPAPLSLTIQTTFPQHHQPVRTLSWAPDERAIVSGGNDHLALIWSLDGTLLQTLAFPAPIRALAWSPDGTQIVAGAANVVSFFDANTGVLLAENAELHSAPVTALGWTQTTIPVAVSAATDTRAVVWNGQTHQPYVVFRQHTTALEALAVQAETVATASQGGIVRVWNAVSGQETHGYYAPSAHPLRTIAFSSTGSLATGGDDGMVSLWKDGRACIQQTQAPFGMQCVDAPVYLPRQDHPRRALTFSPDGTILATGGDDQYLLLWSVSPQTLLLIQPLPETLATLSWSPSGRWLAGACGSQVLIWHIHL